MCVGLGSDEIKEDEDYKCFKCNGENNTSVIPSMSDIVIKQEVQEDLICHESMPEEFNPSVFRQNIINKEKTIENVKEIESVENIEDESNENMEEESIENVEEESIENVEGEIIEHVEGEIIEHVEGEIIENVEGEINANLMEQINSEQIPDLSCNIERDVIADSPLEICHELVQHTQDAIESRDSYCTTEILSENIVENNIVENNISMEISNESSQDVAQDESSMDSQDDIQNLETSADISEELTGSVVETPVIMSDLPPLNMEDSSSQDVDTPNIDSTDSVENFTVETS